MPQASPSVRRLFRVCRVVKIVTMIVRFIYLFTHTVRDTARVVKIVRFSIYGTDMRLFEKGKETYV